MKSMQKSKIDRLRFLLKQTEIFAHFLVGNKNTEETENANTDNKSKGKNSIRKRNNNNNNTKNENLNILKSLKELEKDDDIEIEQPQVTRLYYQPSILTGGNLTEYQLIGLNWLISLYETGLNGILADEMVNILI